MSEGQRRPTAGSEISAARPEGPETQAERKAPRCPSCGRPRVQRYRPFCSERCRDLDLARWFGEAYAVPAVEPGYDEEGGDPS